MSAIIHLTSDLTTARDDQLTCVMWCVSPKNSAVKLEMAREDLEFTDSPVTCLECLTAEVRGMLYRYEKIGPAYRERVPRVCI